MRVVYQPLLVTPEQAAASLSLGRTTVYQLIKSGQLHSVRIRGSRRIPVAALEAYVGSLTDSVNSLTVLRHGIPDDHPGGDPAPPQSSPGVPLDRSGPSQGGARRAGLAREQGRTVPFRATAAQVDNHTEAEAH